MNAPTEIFPIFFFILCLCILLGVAFFIWRLINSNHTLVLPDELSQSLKSTIVTHWENLPRWARPRKFEIFPSEKINITDSSNGSIITTGFLTQLTPPEQKFLIASYFEMNAQFARRFAIPLIAFICSPQLFAAVTMKFSAMLPFSLITLILVFTGVPKIKAKLALEADQNLVASKTPSEIAVTALQKLAGSNPDDRTSQQRLKALFSQVSDSPTL